MFKKSKTSYVLIELAHHLPFSIFGVAMGIVAMGVLTFFATLMSAEYLLPEASTELFHVFHPTHVLISAVATTTMFVKHEKRLLKASAVGFLGSILICGLSDIIFPFIGGVLFGAKMHMHICVLENPLSVVPFAMIGVIAGLCMGQTMEISTQYSHSAHVFISSAASILYLIGFGLTDWIHVMGSVFMITIVAVMLPCCLSDIVFPLACVHRDCTHGEELKHEH